MTLPEAPTDRNLQIYLSLAQYPILSAQMRAKMRRELFQRGIITPQSFENEVREKAIHSQSIEGLHDPFTEEPAEIWEMRLMRIRDHLTDFHFAYNLPFEIFEKIVAETLDERGAWVSDLQFSFNPELAPQNLLFEQAAQIERMPASERSQHEARLQEIKVVLIRTMISDQLAYVKIAKDWFTIADLNAIRTHKIGQGKIGGKSAGMLLAARILNEVGDDEIRACLETPESYFLGADLTYTFMAINGLIPWADQKYKLEEEIRADYPKIQEEFCKGEFPNDILMKFRDLLEQVGKKPLIIRSSSLLEDNFGTSFAGKYESFFCPNQGTLDENLREFTAAIIKIYASMLNPNALLYRRAKGLQDYDERMAVLVQVVQGEQHGRYYMPFAAGVAFSRNMYRWSPKIRREDGFVRMVWGLGTRAVDRVGNDYARLIALSHPLLHPEASPKAIRRYSQQYVDLINLEENSLQTLPARAIIDPHSPDLRYFAMLERDDYLSPIHVQIDEQDADRLVITFDELLRRTQFAKLLSRMLQLLEDRYGLPVDTEFTAQVLQPFSPQPEVRICLLQCRPQSHIQMREARIPKDLQEDDIIFSTSRMAPEGRIEKIEYVVFVSPEGYFSLQTASERSQLSRAIGAINNLLKDKVFITIGPGRWGTASPDLGVWIGYGDIYHTRALVELTGKFIGPAPEPSFGTHFFQDLVESNIFPLAIDLEDADVIFDREFFYETPNLLETFLPAHKNLSDSLRIIGVNNFASNHHLEVVMDDQAGKTVAYLEPDR